ncbi:MAG TPA: metalloregulator ArsR/SmtB family transcription factor [Micromonosporaceae bacterium]|nr:metalloregulator ArsR/SmtB family transcription factor [Micromonosporaceae bacterium]
MVVRGGGRPAGGVPDTFAAVADPTRRVLLERLAPGERTAGELGHGMAMSQAAISQHLRLLLDTGLVEARQDGRFRHYRLRPDGFAAFREWLTALERFWIERVTALDDYLERS